MEMRVVRLHFYGYTWEEYAFQISSLTGIFIVYSGNLTSDGEIALDNVLYIGYHSGIFELYEKGIFDNIEGFVPKGGRIFLSYAEVPSCSNPEDLVCCIENVAHPKYIKEKKPCTVNMKITCSGNCALIPKETINIYNK